MTTPQVLLAAAVVLAGLFAIFLGSPLTMWTLRHVQRRPAGTHPTVSGLHVPEVVLHGGQIIGMLERTAVFFGILAGWPEAMVGVVALKGLGRFAELSGDTEGTAERFLIGSMTSLVWAGLLGGLARMAWQALWV